MTEQTKKPHDRGKPRKAPISDELLEKVAKMAGMGLPQKYLAVMCDMAESTFEKMRKEDERVNQALKKGEQEALGAVITTAWEMASSGKQPAMTMFYLKCRGRWRENDSASDDIDLKECKD